MTNSFVFLTPLYYTAHYPMSIVLKAGMVIYRNKNNVREFLLIYRKKHSDWSFPKGHLEDGETTLQTAIREVREETGLAPIIIKRLEPLHYTSRKQKEIALEMFLAMCDSDDFSAKTESDETPSWIPEKDVFARLTHENLKRYFLNTILPSIEN